MNQELKDIIKIISNYSRANHLNEFAIIFDDAINEITLRAAPLTAEGLSISYDILADANATKTEYKEFKKYLTKALNKGFLKDIKSYSTIYFIESV